MDWLSFVLGAMVPTMLCIGLIAEVRQARQDARGWMTEGERQGRLLEHHGIVKKGGRR